MCIVPDKDKIFQLGAESGLITGNALGHKAVIGTASCHRGSYRSLMDRSRRDRSPGDAILTISAVDPLRQL